MYGLICQVIRYDKKSQGALAYLALAGEMLRRQEEALKQENAELQEA